MKLSEAERKEFRSAIPDCHPIKPSGRVLHHKKKPKPIPRQSLKDEEEVLENLLHSAVDWDVAETGEELLYLRQGAQKSLLRKLRRGHFAVQGQLDLHGLTTPEAKETLGRFLGQACRLGLKCIRVVHGKGLRSPQKQPVLKRKVGNWLRQRDEVLAYAQARRTEGGAGAVMVLLNPNKSVFSGRST